MATGTRARRAAKAEPTPEPAETTEDAGGRGPGEMHELFAEFVEAETGVAVTAEQVFAITSKRVAFRKSDAYVEYRDRLDAEREEAAAAKDKRKTERAAAPAAEAPAEETAKPARAGRRGRPALKAVTTEEPAAEEAPKPARRGRPRRGAAAAEEAPF